MSITWLIFEILGTVAFAFSGAVVGLYRRMDIFGITVLAVMTGVGGGMIRDVLCALEKTRKTSMVQCQRIEKEGSICI